MPRPIQAVLLAALTLVAPALAQQPVQTEVFLTGLVRPVEMVQHPSRSDVFFVAEQDGRVRVVENGVLSPDPVIDIVDFIRFGHPERGLIAMAIDPAEPTHLYLHYTRNPVGASRVDRFILSAAEPWTADINTRTEIIERPQPSVIHSGNALRFGPDGYLYIAYGDGGPVGDPNMQGQNKDTIFGTIVRITPLPAGGYQSPPDNPFVGTDGADEIWHYGLRNPWKFSFDVGPCSTGGMLIGDVGDTNVEEVNFALPTTPGQNFGWSCFEGTLPFFACAPPPGEIFTDPIFEYDRSTGLGRSVTAGFVYRGAAMPHNRGRAFFGDFIFGRIMSVRLLVDPITGAVSADDFRDHTPEITGLPAGSVGLVVGFVRDAAGEPLIIDYAGRVLRLSAQDRAEDLDLDGTVGAGDLAILLADWGATHCPPADLDNDESVGAADLAALLAAWGS